MIFPEQFNAFSMLFCRPGTTRQNHILSSFYFFVDRAAANMEPEEYLTIEEVSARLKIRPKTIKNKMAAGTFQKGVHYFSPAGLRPRFKWSAVVAWLEGEDATTSKADDAIPMARGYALGGQK